MKKTYKNPVIRIVKVQTTQILANSLGIQGNAQGSTMLSRRQGGFLDDEYDEE